MFYHSDAESARVIAQGKASNVATVTRAESVLTWKVHEVTGTVRLGQSTHQTAAKAILDVLREQQLAIDAIGHRFVHGGERFSSTTRIDAPVLKDLRACFPLAPIHNPNSFQVIETCLERLPQAPQYAVFDTAFHAHLPPASRTYALPQQLCAQHGFRKYGFHGLSYQYVSGRAAAWLGKPLDCLRLIICHLGTGGSSVAAVREGRSMDTSMGYSPLPGLVMSTRCGDVDAEIVLELMRQGRSADEVSHLLNDQSGLLGLSGFSSNLEEIIAEAEKGVPDCQRAYDVYVHRLRLYLGAYTWLLNGADAIIFTDDIGLRCWKLRARVLSDVSHLGVVLDEDANRKAPAHQISAVHTPSSQTQVLLVPTDEERVIYEEVVSGLFGRLQP